MLIIQILIKLPKVKYRLDVLELKKIHKILYFSQILLNYKLIERQLKPYNRYINNLHSNLEKIKLFMLIPSILCPDRIGLLSLKNWGQKSTKI